VPQVFIAIPVLTSGKNKDILQILSFCEAVRHETADFFKPFFNTARLFENDNINGLASDPMTTDIQQILLTKPIIHPVHLTRLPLMPAMFCRLLMSAFTKPARIPDLDRVTKARLYLAGIPVDPERVLRYRSVCGYSQAPDVPFVPPGFLQTLFIRLLARYITSEFFPVNPMGLIQTGQQFDVRHPVRIGDRLNLSCTLQEMASTPKGIRTRFLLEAGRDGRPVWQGISTYLTRTSGHRHTAGKKVWDQPLPVWMTIRAPSGTGRKYARVSGDYNPHHLSDVTARIIGFRQAMAHGMWSLARTLACLEPVMGFPERYSVDTAFKLPVYMPATLSVGGKQVTAGGGLHRIWFDLRDAETRKPHLKGVVTLSGKAG
jgi:acyl dehydratase